MKIKIFVPLLLLVMSVTAQNTDLDSLKIAIENVKSDTGKISALIDLSYQLTDSEERLATTKKAYEFGRKVESIKHKSRSEIIYGMNLSESNLDSGIILIDQGVSRYLSNEMWSYASNALYLKGFTYDINSKYDSAIVAYKKAFEIASPEEIHPEWGDAAYSLSIIYNTRGDNVNALKWSMEAKLAYEKGRKTKELSQTLNQAGIIYDQKGLYSEALDSYLLARELASQVEDIEGEILINNNIGVIYDNMNNTEMAMEYYSDALEKSRIHNMPENEATLLNNMSYIHLRNGDTLKAVDLLQKSLEIDLSKTYPCFESYPLEGMATIYLAQGKLDSAGYLLNKALKVSEECEDVVVIATVFKDLGQLASMQKDYSSALASLTKSLSLSRKSSLRTETKEALYEMYKYYKTIGDAKSAMTYLEKFQLLTDSINNENNVEKATKLAAEYEFRKQVAEMEKNRLEAEVMLSKEIEAKTNENRLILLILGLILIFALAMIRGYFLIQRNNKRLKALNEEKNKLIGIVAHDLRNPLNMIMGLMPLINESLKDSQDENLTKYFELLDASSIKMNNMIDRVLDISAIENMKVNLKMDKVDLNDLTIRSIQNFDLIASKKNIKIINDVVSQEAHVSTVDPNYLEQVIDNLLSNAIKFSEKGKRIHVSLKTENNKNEIEVRDEGPGISEEERKELFKAFKTLSSKPTNQERSTGLGLSIAYKFIKAMKGEIVCESTLGEGTSFKLIFEKA